MTKKTKKNVKVRDLKPKKDAKGGSSFNKGYQGASPNAANPNAANPMGASNY